MMVRPLLFIVYFMLFVLADISAKAWTLPERSDRQGDTLNIPEPLERRARERLQKSRPKATEEAKERGLGAMRPETGKAIVAFLANDLLEGREAGTRGGISCRNLHCLRTAQIGSDLFPLRKECFGILSAPLCCSHTTGRLSLPAKRIGLY